MSALQILGPTSADTSKQNKKEITMNLVSY